MRGISQRVSNYQIQQAIVKSCLSIWVVHFKAISFLIKPIIHLHSRLLPHIIGNIGFVFTKEDLLEIRDVLLSNQKEAPAKAGAIAPVDVFVAKVNTGLGPEKTSFFQALSIPTKITKGTIEIMVRR